MPTRSAVSTKSLSRERRKFVRSEFPSRMAIDLVQPPLTISDGGINLSEGGLCLRLQKALEVRSLVRFRLLPEGQRPPAKDQRSVECTGRVAWVVQRLDLRDAPPFLFDIGIEFVNPPSILRNLMGQPPGATNSKSSKKETKVRERVIEPWYSHDRQFSPRLTRDSQQSPPWHLVISVDGAPCFSERFKSEKEALSGWQRFKRAQSKR